MSLDLRWFIPNVFDMRCQQVSGCWTAEVITSLVLEFMFRGFIFCKFMNNFDERKFLARLVHIRI